MPKYYEISEVSAKRAKDMNSYSDYAPGSATAGYRAMVDEAYVLAEKQKAQVDPMYHDKIDALVDRYARRLAENLNERNAIDARVPSILITGGGNFPVAKKAKQNAARDRNYGEYAEIEKLLDKIRSTGRGGISADDDLAVEKLTKKLEGMESQQTMMKAVNAYYRKHKTLDGCPELTAEQVEKVKASMSQDWRKDPVPFPSYLLTNNNANIRRVRQRIEELSHKTEFVAEHHRRQDLIRFRINGTNQNVYNGKSWFCKDAKTDKTDRHCDIFPLPKSALDGNIKLKQNPGYGGAE